MDRTSPSIDSFSLDWMPLSPGIAARILRLAGEERTLQLRVDPGVSVGLHRHSGHVHAFNLSGSRRLGTGEIAGPGAYVHEPPGNQDCWECIGDEPCVVQIAMSGRLEYLGPDGEVVSFTDTPSLRAQYLAWCRETGRQPIALGAE